MQARQLHLLQALVAEMSTLQQLSIIIPFAPDDMAWEHLLSDLEKLPADSEIILVAASEAAKIEAAEFIAKLPLRQSLINCPSRVGGNPEGLKSLGSRLRGNDGFTINQSFLRIISSTLGRSVQMNAGAKAAQNPCLWFLHADSRIDTACLKALETFDYSKKSLGYFGLRFQADGPRRMGINRFGVWFRSRFLRIPFGDQGFVISKSCFEMLGAFREDLSSGEDHAFVWKARKNGVALKHLNASIQTSARKYMKYGWGKTTRLHLRETWRQARQFSKQAKT